MREVDTGDTVECRPYPFIFWGGVFGSASVLLITWLLRNDKSSASVSPGLFVFLIAFLLATLGWSLYVLSDFLRHRVIAERDGLRWRGVLGGWRSVPWHQVTDYYTDKRNGFIQSETQTLAPVSVIVTANGTVRIASDLANVKELQRAVRERATSARVSAWELLGSRRVDEWPRTFRYWEVASPRQAIIDLSVYAAIIALIAVGFMRIHSWFAGVSTPDETSRIATTLSFGFAISLFPLVAAAWKYFTLWRLRGETITVTPETVRYDNSMTRETLEVPWGSVSDYFYRADGTYTNGIFSLVLHGADEKQITWSRHLKDAPLLLAIVQAHAPKPANVRETTESWRSKSPHEATGGSDPETWQGGAVGVGGRVFAQKNTETATLIGGFTLVILMIAVLCASQWLRPGPRDDYRYTLGTTLIFSLPALWGWICFFRTRVETDDMGMTRYTPFRKIYLPWFAVADYEEARFGGKPLNFMTITGQNGGRYRLYSALNGYEELRGEIERYAPPPKTGSKMP
ncbi:MAG: hypothetical protein H8F28_10890 [Fibrella sp.]|nr:hypothetical protein [Armatimonadota bacterium]